jgi:hypothetical protein
MRVIAGLVLAMTLIASVRIARADPDPKRRVIVLEYRAGSSALSGIAARVTAAISKQTSLEVLGPDQTRAIYGDHLEQGIARCAGDAACIARIGEKVAAAEVVLIGVSELGDVILTMQRIEVSGRSVQARVADSLASGAVPSDDQLEQYLSKLLPPGDFVRFGVLDIIANEAGAAVAVGGTKRGATPLSPLKLPAPASYEIRVTKDGFLPFTASVRLPPDSEVKLPVQLQRPGGGIAWYQHWYVIAGVSLLVAGAAGGTLYYETLKTSDHVPVMGTLN